jgi:nicotinamidase-related amidase
VANVARVVAAGRAAGCNVIHCLAATRADRRGSSANAPLFAAAAKAPVALLPGSEAVALVDGIEVADSDLFSTRLAGLSPVNGTEVPQLLRNLGATTVVIVGVSTNVAVPNATFDCVNAGFSVVIRATRSRDTRRRTPT